MGLLATMGARAPFLSSARMRMAAPYALICLVLCFFGSSRPAHATTATEIETLPVLDALKRTESPLSSGGIWSALAWDTSKSGHNTGEVTTSGWRPYDAFSVVNGAYWNQNVFKDIGGGAAASVKMQVSPSNEKRYLAIWLNMTSPGSTKSGYQLSWTQNSDLKTYTARLSKWSAGTQTVLASNPAMSIPAGTTMAISDSGKVVTAWMSTGGSLSSVLSAEDSAFSSGYVGIEGSGNISRSTEFKGGILLGGAISNAPILDNLQRDEQPLASEGWVQTSWAYEIGSVWNSAGFLGYGSTYSQLLYISGAYLSSMTFSDVSGGALVAATLRSPTQKGEYLALWLNMPEPESSQSGYEARLTREGVANHYTAEISKWVAGKRTVLASKSELVLSSDTTFALTEANGSLKLWTGTGSFSLVLSGEDSLYSSGYVGVEVYGWEGTIYNFRGGEPN